MARVSEQIFADIMKSDIVLEEGRIRFYFSKTINKDKFLARKEEHHRQEKERLHSITRLEIDAKDYYNLTLYTKIENYGFRIKVEGCEKECLSVDQVKLDGLIQTRNVSKRQ